MADLERNKRVLRDFIQAVWIEGNLDALGDFWTEDCVNHAMPGPENRGLAALYAYHDGFAQWFAAFSDMRLDILQQIAEDDRVLTYIAARLRHTGPFQGVPPTGRMATMTSMRVDRLEDGKIAEHWSVADVAGLMQQLQG
jgi:steroid delta-isomerase-like uncharacterized protein